MVNLNCTKRIFLSTMHQIDGGGEGRGMHGSGLRIIIFYPGGAAGWNSNV